MGQTAVPHKEVFSMHHGNSAYIQVSNGIYENFSNYITLDLGASRGSLLSQGCAVRNNDPAADREDVFVFSVEGLALFK